MSWRYQKAWIYGECILNMTFSFDNKYLVGTIHKVIVGESVIEGGKGNV